MTVLCCVVWCCVQLTLGSFLALLGLCLEENRHQLVSSIDASSITPHSNVVPFKCNHQLILKVLNLCCSLSNSFSVLVLVLVL